MPTMEHASKAKGTAGSAPQAPAGGAVVQSLQCFGVRACSSSASAHQQKLDGRSFEVKSM